MIEPATAEQLQKTIRLFNGKAANPAQITGSLENADLDIRNGEVIITGKEINLRHARISNATLMVTHPEAVIDLRGAHLEGTKIIVQFPSENRNIRIIYDDTSKFTPTPCPTAIYEKRPSFLTQIEEGISDLRGSFSKHFDINTYLREQKNLLCNSVDRNEREKAARNLGDYIREHRHDEDRKTKARVERLYDTLSLQFYREDESENASVAMTILGAIAGIDKTTGQETSSARNLFRATFWDHLEHLKNDKAIETLTNAVSRDPRLEVRRFAATCLAYVPQAAQLLKDMLFDREDPTGELGLESAVSLKRTISFYGAPKLEAELIPRIFSNGTTVRERELILTALSCSKNQWTRGSILQIASGRFEGPGTVQMQAMDAYFDGMKYEALNKDLHPKDELAKRRLQRDFREFQGVLEAVVNNGGQESDLVVQQHALKVHRKLLSLVRSVSAN